VTQPPGERDAVPARAGKSGRGRAGGGDGEGGPDGEQGGRAGDNGRRLGLALFLVSAAQFTLQLDFSIVNVALATIQREFGVPAADLQWIVTGYALPFGALLLLGGRIGDLTGHRRLLGSGLAAFGVTSLAAGLAPGAGVLIGARFAQGASAALVAPMALATIADLFPDGPERARALGIYQGATAAGASAGIVLGGILTEYAGWRAIFLVNPPVIAALIAAMMRLLPRGGHAAGGHAAGQHAVGARGAGGGVRGRLDLAGAVLVTVSAAALIFGLSQGQQQGFAAPLTLGALTAAVALGAAFGVAERRAPAPMIPLGVLADRARRVALAAVFAVASVVVGYVYFVTLYMQRVLGFSPLRAGLGLLPATLTVLVTSTWLARRLAARFGARAVLAAGLASIGLGQAWLTQLSPSGSYLGNVLPGLMLTSFGMGLLFPTAAVLATAGVAPGDRGLAGGLLAASQQVGMAVGLAVLATVAAAGTRAAAGPYTAALVSGYRLSYLVGAAITACALAGVLLFLPAARAQTSTLMR
jgi:MFS family permease